MLRKSSIESPFHKVGSYMLERSPVGFGSYGTVYRGLKDDQTYAIKIYKLNRVTMYFGELEAYKGLEHDNIIKLHDYEKKVLFYPSDK